MLRIDLLPAAQGDCIWIEYGDPNSPRFVLIDGGTTGSVQPLVDKIRQLPAKRRRLELLVVTHVDADHIAGVLKLMKTPTLGLAIRDVWFNGYRHLVEGLETFGPEQGEELSASIIAAKLPWNEAFGHHAVRVADAGPLPVKTLDGGLELVILGPTVEKLRRLEPVWNQACIDAGIRPGQPQPVPPPPGLEVFGPIDVDTLADAPFKADAAEANGSSIILLLRYAGTTVLLGADGYPSVTEGGLGRLSEEGIIKLDAYKVAHHGSEKNLSQSLLQRIQCSRYLFSSNGAIYQHPTPQAVARALKYSKRNGRAIELVFNYRTEYTSIWDSASLQERWGYTTVFPVDVGVMAFEKD